MEERKVKLELKDMAKKYDNGDGVEHINLKVYEGEIVTFLGPSGCGKSTILRTIGGFMDVTDGDILVDGQSIVNLPPEKRPTAMVFQSYNLWPHMTIYENLAFGLKLRKVPKKEIDAEIKKMLELVSMSGFEKKYPGQLSGGQQQRIAIARSLLLKPSLLLLDEPFSALDEFLKDRLQQELIQMLEDYPGTVILVSHSRDEIYRFSDELIVMDQGKVVCHGNTEETFDCPEWKEAARLTGCKNITEAIREDEHHLQVPGWGIRFTLEQQIDEDIRYVGIRAHDFEPIWLADGEQPEEGWIKVKVDSVAKLPFEHKYFLKESEEQEDVCWFVQRDLWDELEKKGMPGWLKIPEEKLLLLK